MIKQICHRKHGMCFQDYLGTMTDVAMQPVENPQMLPWAEAAFPSPGRGNREVANWKAGEKEMAKKSFQTRAGFVRWGWKLAGQYRFCQRTVL